MAIQPARYFGSLLPVHGFAPIRSLPTTPMPYRYQTRWPPVPVSDRALHRDERLKYQALQAISE